MEPVTVTEIAPIIELSLPSFPARVIHFIIQANYILHFTFLTPLCFSVCMLSSYFFLLIISFQTELFHLIVC